MEKGSSSGALEEGQHFKAGSGLEVHGQKFSGGLSFKGKEVVVSGSVAEEVGRERDQSEVVKDSLDGEDSVKPLNHDLVSLQQPVISKKNRRVRFSNQDDSRGLTVLNGNVMRDTSALKLPSVPDTSDKECSPALKEDLHRVPSGNSPQGVQGSREELELSESRASLKGDKSKSLDKEKNKEEENSKKKNIRVMEEDTPLIHKYEYPQLECKGLLQVS